MEEQIKQLLYLINLEEKAQQDKYKLIDKTAYKQLKADGVLLHPLKIVNKSFGFADYPEFEFRIPFGQNVGMFKNGAAVELVYQSEEPIKGVLLIFDGSKGEIRLYSSDYPDWIDEHGIALKLAPDTHTSAVMKSAVKQIAAQKHSNSLFAAIYNLNTTPLWKCDEIFEETVTHITHLNESQNSAVKQICTTNNIAIVHGPPGTGKTTTLAHAIQFLTKHKKKIVVAAPSNTAVDNIAAVLLKMQIDILRVGNTTKVNASIFPYTIEGKMNQSNAELKQVRDLKKQADAFRKMALQYKRSFGKAEREQRNLLMKEVKEIGFQIKKIFRYKEDSFYEKAQVVLGTPVGLVDAGFKAKQFDYIIIDEAGQCLAPLAWAIIPLADKVVMAGDHLQLPPTVIGKEAMQKGLSKSILEYCIQLPDVTLLNVQYRMKDVIANFSSQYFYAGKVQTPANLLGDKTSITFIDTAGTGFEEQYGSEGTSLENDGELKVVNALLAELASASFSKICLISPYNGQVSLAKTKLPQSIMVSTIDSFQGQEADVIIISLVRSNAEQQIGFLNDYRRMNVAITRAKQKLFVIGDGATLSADKFYDKFIAYVQKEGTYKSAWEYNIWD